MTQQEKEILIGKMLDSAFSLTEEELDLIRHDEELRDIHGISAILRSACIRPLKIDVEKEWRLFRRCLRPRPSPWRWICTWPQSP